MTAREKFKVGDRVRLSAKGDWRHGQQLGRVTGFGRKPWRVRVLRDGHKAAGVYGIDEWDVVIAAASEPT